MHAAVAVSTLQKRTNRLKKKNGYYQHMVLTYIDHIILASTLRRGSYSHTPQQTHFGWFHFQQRHIIHAPFDDTTPSTRQYKHSTKKQTCRDPSADENGSECGGIRRKRLRMRQSTSTHRYISGEGVGCSLRKRIVSFRIS